MLQERIILMTLVLGLMLLLAHKQPEKRVVSGDPDFEEFYLDLCGSTLTVDFTREEAEKLYRVWQGQSNSVEIQKEKMT